VRYVGYWVQGPVDPSCAERRQSALSVNVKILFSATHVFYHYIFFTDRKRYGLESAGDKELVSIRLVQVLVYSEFWFSHHTYVSMLSPLINLGASNLLRAILPYPICKT
jgi:hypothetical protein